jgi:sulfate adenylyltransferase
VTYVLPAPDADRLLLFLADAAPIPPVLPDDEDLVDDEAVPLARTDAIGAVSVLPAGRDAADRIRAARRDFVTTVWADRPIGARQLATIAATAGAGVQLLVPTRPGGEWSSGARRSLADAAAAVLRDTGVDPVWVDPLPVPAETTDAETADALRRLGRSAVAVDSDSGDLDPPVTQAVARHRRPPAGKGVVVFFTGLSGSGKSTVARAVAERLQADRTVTLLDGDRVRRLLSSGLGFSRADRDTNVARIGFVAAEIARHGGIAVCAPIAPYASTRATVRLMAAEADAAFLLVYVATPLAECERRDRKGLYAKARAGLIPEFTGISDPYEAPEDADLVLDTTGRDVADCADEVLTLVRTQIC